MAAKKNPKQTGKAAASEAARLLANKKTPAKVKKVAASDLAQARPRPKKR